MDNERREFGSVKEAIQFFAQREADNHRHHTAQIMALEMALIAVFDFLPEARGRAQHFATIANGDDLEGTAKVVFSEAMAELSRMTAERRLGPSLSVIQGGLEADDDNP